MKIAFYVAVLVVAANSVGAAEIRLFDPHVLGSSTTAPITPLLPAREGSIEPYMVSLDMSKGLYTSASVFYPKRVALGEVREALGRMYKGSEVRPQAGPGSERSSMALWRVEGIGVAIAIWQEECGIVRVVYMRGWGELPLDGAGCENERSRPDCPE